MCLSVAGAPTNIAKRGDPAPVGTFSSFHSVSVSGDDVVFRAYYDDGSVGNMGIFTSDGVSLNTIIKAGDALFGSTVTDLNFGNRGLDEAGNVAFWYELADGRSGVAIAAVPEPSTVILLGVAVLGLCGHSWRRRKRMA